ncbi:WSC-domain-containing protein [Thozetella sp. PMI_491]|nr:WSC-domain-containing protein [Thozetella sp. PMI_491]
MKLFSISLLSGLLAPHLCRGAIPTNSSATTAVTPSATVPSGVKPSIGGYRYMSCWTEGLNIRALSGASFAYDSMTLESCMANCSTYQFWGTEYGRECYCGNWLDKSSKSAVAGDCNTACGGDASELCGGGNRLVVYSTTAPLTATQAPTPTAKPNVSGYTFRGCWAEGAFGRALSALSYAADDMTLESCASMCASYPYFGTEYGRECYCGLVPGGGSYLALLSDCDAPCGGNSAEICGGRSRLSLYYSNTVQGPSDPVKIGSSTYFGCRTEGLGVRALSGASTANASMTLDLCASFCSGFKYWGTEYGQECYCGNAFGFGSIPAGPGECNMPCSGNASQYCGAGQRLNVYSN